MSAGSSMASMAVAMDVEDAKAGAKSKSKANSPAEARPARTGESATATGIEDSPGWGLSSSQASSSMAVAIEVNGPPRRFSPSKPGSSDSNLGKSNQDGTGGGIFASVRVLGWKNRGDHTEYIVQAELNCELISSGQSLGGRHLPPVSRRYREFFELWRFFRRTFKRQKIGIPELPGKRILHGEKTTRRRMNGLDSALMKLNSLPNLDSDNIAKIGLTHITMMPAFLAFVGYTNPHAAYEIVGGPCHVSMKLSTIENNLSDRDRYLAKIYYTMLIRDSSGFISEPARHNLHLCAMAVNESKSTDQKAAVMWTWPSADVKSSLEDNDKWIGVNRSAFIKKDFDLGFGPEILTTSGNSATSLAAAIVTFDEFVRHWECDPGTLGAKLFCEKVEERLSDSLSAHFALETEAKSSASLIDTGVKSSASMSNAGAKSPASLSDAENKIDLKDSIRERAEIVYDRFLLSTPGLETLSHDKLKFALHASGVATLNDRQLKALISYLDVAHAHMLSFRKSKLSSKTTSVGFISREEFVKLVLFAKSLDLGNLSIFKLQSVVEKESSESNMLNTDGQRPRGMSLQLQGMVTDLKNNIVAVADSIEKSLGDDSVSEREISQKSDIENGVASEVKLDANNPVLDIDSQSLGSILSEIGQRCLTEGSLGKDELVVEIIDRVEALEIGDLFVNKNILKKIVNACDEDSNGVIDAQEYSLFAGVLHASTSRSVSIDSNNDPPEIVAEKLKDAQEHLAEMETTIKSAQNEITNVLNFTLDPLANQSNDNAYNREAPNSPTHESKLSWATTVTSEELQLVNDIVDLLHGEPFFNMSKQRSERLSGCDFLKEFFLPKVRERNLFMWKQEACKSDLMSSVAQYKREESRNENARIGNYTPGLCGTFLGPTFPDPHYCNATHSLERSTALKLDAPGVKLCALARLGCVHDCARILDEHDNSNQLLNFRTELDGFVITPLHACFRQQSVHVGVIILLLRRGADPLAKNGRGETFFEVLSTYVNENESFKFLQKENQPCTPSSFHEASELQKQILSLNHSLNDISVRKMAASALKSHSQALWLSLLQKVPSASSSDDEREKLIILTLGRQRRLQISKSNELRRQYFENVEVLHNKLSQAMAKKVLVTALAQKVRYFDAVAKRQAQAGLGYPPLDRLPNDVSCTYPGPVVAEERIMVWSEQTLKVTESSPTHEGMFKRPRSIPTPTGKGFFALIVYIALLRFALSDRWHSSAGNNVQNWRLCYEASSWIVVESISTILILSVYFIFIPLFRRCFRGRSFAQPTLLSEKDASRRINRGVFAPLCESPTIIVVIVFKLAWFIYGDFFFLSWDNWMPNHLDHCNQEMVVTGFVYCIFPGIPVTLLAVVCIMWLLAYAIKSVKAACSRSCCGKKSEASAASSHCPTLYNWLLILNSMVFLILVVGLVVCVVVGYFWFWAHVVSVGEHYLSSFTEAQKKGYNSSDNQGVLPRNDSSFAPAPSIEVPQVCKNGAQWLVSLGIVSIIFGAVSICLNPMMKFCRLNIRARRAWRILFILISSLTVAILLAVGMSVFLDVELKQHCAHNLWAWGFGVMIYVLLGFTAQSLMFGRIVESVRT